MAAVLGHGSPTGALQQCHSFNHDITGLAKGSPKSRPVNIGQQEHLAWIGQCSYHLMQ